MAHDGETHIDDAVPFLDQPIAEPLMIPFDVVMLRVLPNGLA